MDEQNKISNHPEESAMYKFRTKAEKAMANIQSLEEFRNSDSMIDFVFKIGHEMFQKDLDTMGLQWLINTGGKLTAIYAYLGNKTAYARAQRDVYQQKRDETMARISLDEYPDTEKITVAKARAKLQVIELDEIVTQMEYGKNNMENLLAATDKMVGFIQSAIRVKQGDQFRSKTVSDN
ncbi:hypothetical protein M0R01_04600 [bacterium]|jgi:hypothetical protein|nr:hypothetical protein [bacterium]